MAWIVGPMKYSTKSSLSVAGAAGDMTFATGENAPELRPAICTPLRPIETATPGRIAFNPTNGPGAVPTRTDFLRSPAPSGQVSRNSNIPLEGSTRHSLLIEDGESVVSYFNLEIKSADRNIACSLPQPPTQRRPQISGHGPRRARYPDRVGARSARVPGTHNECVVRSHL